VTITDRQSRVWDVSVAVYKHGFDPDEFEHGLGINVIRPVVEPEFVAPGEVGYPDTMADFPVIGVAIEIESRAYPIASLTRHEVVNDFVGDTPIMVRY
jgi:hypothetical protein